MEYKIEQMAVADDTLEEVKGLLHLSFPNRTEKFKKTHTFYRVRIS
jgi:hypothetical protein